MAIYQLTASREQETLLAPFSPREDGITCRCRQWPCSDNPCFCGKAPSRIKPVDLIDRSHLHVRRILALAQRRRDARHHCRRDASDTTCNSTMNMAAENGDDPPGALQSPAHPRQDLRRFEVQPIRPYRNLEWWMVRENRNRLGGLGIDQVGQTSRSARRKSHPCCCPNSRYPAQSVLPGSRQSHSR